MRKIIGLLLLGLLLLGLLGGGIYELQRNLAEGESPILALLIIAIPLLAAGATVAALLGRLIGPLRGAGLAATARGLIALVVAGTLELGVYTVSADVPLQRPDVAVTAAVAAACSHQPVSAAGTLVTDGTELNHVVVLDSRGDEFGWTGKPPVAWRPPSVDDVELVVCVDAEDTVEVLEVCDYSGGPDVTRYTATRELTIVAARTGAVLAHGPITSNASSCPGVLAEDVTELAAEVAWYEVENRLESLVTHGRYEPLANDTVVGSGGGVEPGESGESGDGTREATVQAGVDDGLLAVTAKGDSLQSLDVTVRSKGTEPLEITIPLGTVFTPFKASVQTMVVIAPATIRLEPGEAQTIEVDVACSQMHDAQPGDNGKRNGFDLTGIATGALARLLRSSDFASAEFRVRQFAIWTITDNPARAGYVGLGSFGFGSGPSKAELREIRSIFRDADIDPGHYRALR